MRKLNYFLAAFCFYITLGQIGYWCVYYPDCGKYSVRMSYSEAKNYALIFKGLMVWEW